MKQIQIQGCGLELNYLSNEKEHAHQNMELIYIIENSVQIGGEEKFRLAQNQFAVINPNQKHSFSETKDTIAFRMTVPYRTLSSLAKEQVILFRCNTVLYASPNDKEMKKLLETLMLRYLSMSEQDVSELCSLQFQIIHMLMSGYRADITSVNAYIRQEQSRKIDRILNYICLHYFEPLNLKDVAEYFRVSESYLSRYFKNKTGQNFVNYLNEIRAENAAQELRDTDNTITNIAVDNGFSTPSVMNRYFRQFYGITPSAYRKEALKNRENKTLKQEKEELLKRSLYEQIEKETKKQTGIKRVDIKVSENDVEWRNPSKIINIGEIASVSDAAIQQHTLFLKEVLGIEYIRIWGLFSERFMIATDFSGNSFNFEFLDRIFDFFVQNKLNLFVDLGKRNRVIMAGGNDELYSEKHQYHLKTREEWENLLEHFIVHLIRRYNRNVIQNWIFEFPWNTEDYYEEDYTYMDAYESGFRIIKNNLGNCRVAGGSPNGDIDEEQFRNMAEEMKQQRVIPDIFTVKIFPDYFHQMMGNVTDCIGNDYLYARAFVEKIKKILEEKQMRCPICISEWSNSISNRTIIQDSCSRGTYILKFILSIWKLVDMMGFWHGSDAVDIYYDSKRLIYGGGGILTKDGIKKPSFYAFEFLNKLGRNILKVGNNYIVTRNSYGALICLCFNHREYSYYYYMKKENEHLNLSKVFQSEEREKIEFSIGRFDDEKTYIIKEEVVNRNHGSIQDEWRLLGNQEELKSEEIQYLNKICIPKIYMKQIQSIDGRIRFEVELEPHEMRLIYIYEY